MAVHFVGFKDDRYHNAVRVFGEPAFIHRVWDRRARNGGEFDSQNDVFVFATGDENSTVKEFTFDDSAHF